jgi:hypothetical protein
MKRSIRALCAVLTLSLLTGPALLYADLESFKQDVEDEEEANRSEEEEEEEESEGGGESNPFLSFLYHISAYLWLAHNGSVHYDDYPYGPAPAAFIGHDMERSRVYWDDVEPGWRASLSPAKTHWFELAAGGIYSDDWGGSDYLALPGYGGFLSLQGRFTPFVGPDIDYRFYYDPSGELHTTGVGLDFPLVQADPFAWSFYGKWMFWRGVLNREGGASGFTFRSYLFRPVSLYLRAGGIFFPAITFGQVEGRLNIHLGRNTIFGGVNLLESETTRLLSYEVGTSIYF